MPVENNRLNFEHCQIKFSTERNPVKGGANPGIEPTRREDADRGRDRNGIVVGSRMGQNFNIPIDTGRDWVASRTTLVQSDWRALCQSTLPAAGQFVDGFSCS